jgi:hypothetical protein
LDNPREDFIKANAAPKRSRSSTNPSPDLKLTRFLSPVQEHHIDFILEEEFACNPAFLPWFLSNVTFQTSSDCPNFNHSAGDEGSHAWDCSAARSIVTGHGETDVLIIYRRSHSSVKTAILIENKIRAGFQPSQSERYRRRGEEGKCEGHWDNYWTCLIAPKSTKLGMSSSMVVCR